MWGYLGLTSAFLVLALILSWILIKSKTNAVLKAAIIAGVMWYGLVSFYTPHNLLGNPKPVASRFDLPDGAWVIGIYVKEPNKQTKAKGAIFFLLVDYSEQDKKRKVFDPRGFVTYPGVKEPQLFKIEYSPKMHKKIMEAEREKRKGGAPMAMRLRVGENKTSSGPASQDDSEASLKFDIVNMVEFLTKDTD